MLLSAHEALFVTEKQTLEFLKHRSFGLHRSSTICVYHHKSSGTIGATIDILVSRTEMAPGAPRIPDEVRLVKDIRYDNDSYIVDAEET